MRTPIWHHMSIYHCISICTSSSNKSYQWWLTTPRLVKSDPWWSQIFPQLCPLHHQYPPRAIHQQGRAGHRRRAYAGWWHKDPAWDSQVHANYASILMEHVGKPTRKCGECSKKGTSNQIIKFWSVSKSSSNIQHYQPEKRVCSLKSHVSVGSHEGIQSSKRHPQGACFCQLPIQSQPTLLK